MNIFLYKTLVPFIMLNLEKTFGTRVADRAVTEAAAPAPLFRRGRSSDTSRTIKAVCAQVMFTVVAECITVLSFTL